DGALAERPGLRRPPWRGGPRETARDGAVGLAETLVRRRGHTEPGPRKGRCDQGGCHEIVASGPQSGKAAGAVLAAKRSPPRPGPARALGLRARSDGPLIVSQTAPPMETNDETARLPGALAASACAAPANGTATTRPATPPGTTRRPNGAVHLHRRQCLGADRGHRPRQPKLPGGHDHAAARYDLHADRGEQHHY